MFMFCVTQKGARLWRNSAERDGKISSPLLLLYWVQMQFVPSLPALALWTLDGSKVFMTEHRVWKVSTRGTSEEPAHSSDQLKEPEEPLNTLTNTSHPLTCVASCRMKPGVPGMGESESWDLLMNCRPEETISVAWGLKSGFILYSCEIF